MEIASIFQAMGTFYVVSTPIGNLRDLSPRAGETLASVALVLAEDTRRSAILLNHLGVKVPLRSCHRHNEASRVEETLRRLGEGEDVALVSDAGTPLVSDPGERLVARVIEAGHPVVAIPGPSAILAALVTSGLPALPFTFVGFPPRKGKDRKAFLTRLAAATETVVLFESPERVAALLHALAETPGGEAREASVSRELTKLHEETRRGTLEALARYYEEDPPKGEVTVVLGPATPLEASEDADREAVDALGAALLREGTSPSRAARQVARRLGLPRNEVYRWIQELSSEMAGPEADGPDR